MSAYQPRTLSAQRSMTPTLVRHERRQARLRALALVALRREQAQGRERARTRQERAARR